MLHQYELNGYNIALDSASGAVHVLSSLAAKVLSSLTPPLTEKCPDMWATDPEAAECYNDLYQLYLDGTLFSEDMEIAESGYVSGLIKSMCLHVSHDCNMRCRYCFAGTGDFGRGRLLMDLDTGIRGIADRQELTVSPHGKIGA